MAQYLPDLGTFGWQGAVENVLKSVPGEHPPGERLVIYYSIPTGVNSLFSVERAAQLFSRWDLIVFGQPLQDAGNADHANTVAVIARIHELHPGAKLFGYVSCSVANGASAALTDAQIRAQVDAWEDMGVDGMLLDEFGFDYDVPRTRQNMVIDHVHDAGLVCLINAWVQADAFAPNKAAALAVDPNIVQSDHDTFNPGGVATHADGRDYTLLETWVAHTEFYPAPAHVASIFNIRARADHARHYRTALGVRWIGGSVVNYGTTTAEQQQAYFDLTQAFARVFGADGWAVDALNYSSTAPAGNLGVVKAWSYDRTSLPRDAAYWIDDTAPDDWLTLNRQDLLLTLTGTSTAAGTAWTFSEG